MTKEIDHREAVALAAARDQGLSAAPGEPLELPATAKGLADKAKDLQALRDAVVDAASVGAGLWFSYLFACSTFSLPLAA